MDSDSEGSRPSTVHVHKRTKAARKKVLEEDKYCTDVHPSQVRCQACDCIIKLHSNKKCEYCDTDWKKHKARCPQITGELNRRVCVRPATNDAGAVRMFDTLYTTINLAITSQHRGQSSHTSFLVLTNQSRTQLPCLKIISRAQEVVEPHTT